MKKYRELFPITKKYTYLNHAALTPYSLPVIEALEHINKDITENGILHLDSWLEVREETRKLMADLVATEAENIAFLQNTSEAVAAVANGINWKSGENVVSCDIEFPANIYPWMRLKHLGVELRLAKTDNGTINVNSLLELVDKNTRVIAVSWIQYSSGFRLNLREIGEFCHKNDILFVVDSIQGLGALELNVKEEFVDAFCTNAYKFLMGTMGLGVLYLSEKAIQQVKPTVVGWTSVKEWWKCFDAKYDYNLNYLPSALCFEPGTPDIPGIYALNASLKLLLEIGVKSIEEYLVSMNLSLSNKLIEIGFELAKLQPNLASTLVCCRHPKVPIEVIEQKLAESKIIVAARAGWLRISPHFYNSYEEIDLLIESLSDIVSQ